MKYRIALQILLSLACVILSGLVLRWWALVLWLGVFLYLATAMELVYKAARAAAQRNLAEDILGAAYRMASKVGVL